MKKTLKTLAPIFLLILTLTNAAYANVNEIRVSPEKPVKGDVIKVLIKASPEEEVKITISFKMAIAASNGKYEYRLNNVKIPSSSNSFTVKAANVKNLHISVKVLLLFWVTKSVEAKDGVATLSQSNVPAGTYNIVIHGDAAEEATKVTLQITASTKIVTDQNGIYEYSYDTSSIPPGTFTVKVGDITKTITLYKTQPTSSAPHAPPSKPQTPKELTPEEIEIMSDEKAAQALSTMTPKNASAILEEISEEKAARILSLIEAESAVEIMKIMTENKSALIIDAMQMEKAVQILQGLMNENFANKTAEILCMIPNAKAVQILIHTETNPASKTLEEIAKNNITIGAELVEQAANVNLTKTAMIIENMQARTAAELIIEVSRRYAETNP